MTDTFGVSAVASLAGVTVRTLHHYDELGLLKPSNRSAAGYRRYTADDLARLQSILFYKELGLGLEEIAAAIRSDGADRVAVLDKQRRMIIAERDRLDRMAQALNRAIQDERTGMKMSPQEMFEAFGDFDPSEHQAEAAERWPDAYDTAKQRTSSYSKEQWQEATAEADAIAAGLANLLGSGAAADAADAMALAEQHRLSIDRWYYPCSKDVHVGLAEMYVSDPRFEQYWESRAEGLARFVHDAIKANSAG